MHAHARSPVSASIIAFALVGCSGRGAPEPPVRSSPELTRIDVASPIALRSDPRSGVLTDGSTTLMRLNGAVLETVDEVTREPSPLWQLSIVRSFDGVVWVGSPDETIRVAGGVSTRFVATDCDPSAGGTGLGLLDARAADDVWATVLGVPAGGEVLCHFDGSAWSSEIVPFGIESMVALEGELIAVDDSPIPRLMRRPAGSASWTEISEGSLGGGFAREVTPGGSGAVATTVTLDDDVPVLIGSAIEILPTGTVVGIGDERWQVEVLTGVGEHCSNDSISGARSCVEGIEWVQYVVSRVVDGTSTEVGHVTVHEANVVRGALVLGAGRLGIATEEALFVTP
jgi:hypothetical protein